MNGNTQVRSEFDRQLALLKSDLGARGSGAARYAAAMHFYNGGMLSCELLEIYRRCCKFDNEDPIDIALCENIGLPEFLNYDAGTVSG